MSRPLVGICQTTEKEINNVIVQTKEVQSNVQLMNEQTTDCGYTSPPEQSNYMIHS